MSELVNHFAYLTYRSKAQHRREDETQHHGKKKTTRGGGGAQSRTGSGGFTGRGRAASGTETKTTMAAVMKMTAM